MSGGFGIALLGEGIFEVLELLFDKTGQRLEIIIDGIEILKEYAEKDMGEQEKKEWETRAVSWFRALFDPKVGADIIIDGWDSEIRHTINETGRIYNIDVPDPKQRELLEKIFGAYKKPTPSTYELAKYYGPPEDFEERWKTLSTDLEEQNERIRELKELIERYGSFTNIPKEDLDYFKEYKKARPPYQDYIDNLGLGPSYEEIYGGFSDNTLQEIMEKIKEEQNGFIDRDDHSSLLERIGDVLANFSDILKEDLKETFLPKEAVASELGEEYSKRLFGEAGGIEEKAGLLDTGEESQNLLLDIEEMKNMLIQMASQGGDESLADVIAGKILEKAGEVIDGEGQMTKEEMIATIGEGMEELPEQYKEIHTMLERNQTLIYSYQDQLYRLENMIQTKVLTFDQIYKRVIKKMWDDYRCGG